jgi:hypothetical protein
MHKSATKCNETIGKWCKNKHGASKIIDTLETYQGCALMCFLDAFSSCHQIKMVVEDLDKTAFITPIGCYCYTCMPFGLKNAGATFQRAMRKCLGPQIGHNIKAYINDIVMKSQINESLIDDLRKTFAKLRKVQLKLNPEKCTFGVPSGKLLGYLVSHWGIEANLNKVKAIKEIQAPRRVNDIQRLNGFITALGSGERALPLFKLLKKSGPI